MMNYNTLPSHEVVIKTGEALNQNGFRYSIAKNKNDALEEIKRMIPAGASIMNGTSWTLQQIGFIDLLKERRHSWDNLHDAILREQDPLRQGRLRKESTMADYFLGSVHAVTEDGQLIIASNSGSQIPAYAFHAAHVIWVVSTKKITTTLEAGLERLQNHVVPLEDKRMKDLNMGGTKLNKLFIFKGEPGYLHRELTVLFVEEDLGF